MAAIFRVYRPAFLAVIFAALFAVPGLAQSSKPSIPAEQPNAPASQGHSFFEIVHAGGTIGYVIMLMSLGAVALMIEQGMTLRGKVLMPVGLAEQVRELLATGQVTRAEQLCKLQPSVLSFVVQAGLAERDGGWPAIEKGMEDALAEQSARLFRKVEYLSVIGSLAPMLGLLGTVVGMVMAFRQVAISQGAAQAADLAEGIYLALVTTVQGLVVAIPSLAAFAFFRSRVDQLLAETAYATQHAVAPVKHQRTVAPPVVEQN